MMKILTIILCVLNLAACFEAATTIRIVEDESSDVLGDIPLESSYIPQATPQVMMSSIQFSSSMSATSGSVSQASTEESIRTDPPPSVHVTSSAIHSKIVETKAPSISVVSSSVPSSVTPSPTSIASSEMSSTDDHTPTISLSPTQSASETIGAPPSIIEASSTSAPAEETTTPTFSDFMDNNINFTLNLYKDLSSHKDEGNVFFSPLSIFTSLLMLHYGARGSTAEEMTNAMDIQAISKDPDVIHRLYGDIMSSLSDDPTSQSYILMANKIFAHSNFDIKQDYQDGIKSYYNASVESVDFGAKHTTDLINEWVSHKTNGNIRDLFKSRLSASTSAVLLNALYFRGDWLYEFSPISTVDNAPFYVDANTVVNASMMVNKVKLAYGNSKDLGASILELPYIGDRLSMFVVLPNATNTLENVESHLNIDTLKDMLRSMRRRRINIRLPKFNLHDSPAIAESLAHMGMKELFSPVADLSAIAEGSLGISDLKHEATIDVSETGSVASAASGVVLERIGSSSERHFEADRPFLFFIIDKQNGLILFMGRLQDPTL